MDVFESRLNTTAQRLGWSEEVIREVLRRREQLVAEPDLTAAEIAKQFELAQSDEFELRVLAMRKAPAPAVQGTQFVRDPPRQDAPTEKAAPKPPPMPPSIKASEARKTFPPTPIAAKSRSSDRTVSGRTLKEEIRLAHADKPDDALQVLMRRIASAASFAGNAHREGIVVRSLAPDNLVFGELGEVVFADPSRIPTPAYYSPEQARDATGTLTATSDVFALGCMMFEAFTGNPLFAQVGKEATLKAIVDDDRRPLESPFDVPDALQQIYRRATFGAPGSRQPNGAALAAEIDRWLAGVNTGVAPLETFSDHADMIQEKRNRARILRAESIVMLAAVPAGAPIEEKQPAWTKQDEAAALVSDAARLEREYEAGLDAHLVVTPDDSTVRRLLGEHLHNLHKRLEDDGHDATSVGERLRAIDPKRYAKYLDGAGRLSLVTEPAGASVDLFRYELKDRRLWPVKVESLGTTPLADVKLPMGSYVAILRHPDCADVRYPIYIRRRTHWHGKGPDSGEPTPVHLPSREAVKDGFVYVPSGWFRCGGPVQANAMPDTWTWCAGFLIQRDPVWMRDYLAFLDALAAAGSAELETCIPRGPDGTPLVFAKNGTHQLVAAHPLAGQPDWPATNIPWSAADAYARWYSDKSGEVWRLPADLEWEKAARGVDGRTYPWGNGLDPMFANYEQSHPGAPHPVDGGAFPSDSSPYGVRGMAGNVREWCRDSWQSRESIAAGQSPGVVQATGPKVVRGGHFAMTGPGLECWMRSRVDAATRAPWIGFRLVRRFPG